MQKQNKKSTKKYIDPVERQWHDAHPTFPGLQFCLEKLKTSSGSLIDVLYLEMEEYATQHPEEIIRAYQTSLEQRDKEVLFKVMSLAAHPSFTDYLADELSQKSSLFPFAVHGLRKINTKTSRKALFQHNLS